MEKLRALLNQAVRFLRKLPVARMIRPLWVGAVKDLAAKEIDALALKLEHDIREKGPEVIDKAVDSLQVKMKMGLVFLPLPLGIEEKALVLIQERGDSFQMDLRTAVMVKGAGAVKPVADGLKAVILAKIDAL